MESEQQIELISRALDAVGQRDLTAMRELAAPDIVLQPLMSVWPRPYTGIDGIENWLGDVEELWSDFSISGSSFRSLDDDTVLVTTLWRGVPKGEGAGEVAGPGAALIRFRGDQAIRMQLFLDEAMALRAYDGPDWS